MSDYFELIKAFHIIVMTAWMAGMFYLPRLYVYHTGVQVGSEQDKIFQLMEIKLLRIIINPAMILTLVSGIFLAKIYGFRALGTWFHLKMLLVICMCIAHFLLANWRKDFAKGSNSKSERFYRIFNEAPVVFFIGIVVLVVIKPFEF